MNKKIILNIILLFAIYIMPLYILHQYQNDWRNIYIIQNYVLSVIFIGSIFLIYLNNKYRIKVLIYRWLWVVFMIIGMIGLCYSGFILFLIYSTRNLLS
ncbi:MAG: hypothetical protein US12_C0024G0001 [Parcubacteria group bacterium GW2011_GWA2_36_24]|nr:MAG: hypothetical protein US12_C0024G0001 [Parcubacteria group bacterium GW2011_GWA2_36_24]